MQGQESYQGVTRRKNSKGVSESILSPYSDKLWSLLMIVVDNTPHNAREISFLILKMRFLVWYDDYLEGGETKPNFL